MPIVGVGTVVNMVVGGEVGIITILGLGLSRIHSKSLLHSLLIHKQGWSGSCSPNDVVQSVKTIIEKITKVNKTMGVIKPNQSVFY